MALIFWIPVILLAALVQKIIYMYTKRKFILLLISVASCVFTIYAFITSTGSGPLSEDPAVYALFLGIPTVIGSSIMGIAIAIKE